MSLCMVAAHSNHRANPNTSVLLAACAAVLAQCASSATAGSASFARLVDAPSGLRHGPSARAHRWSKLGSLRSRFSSACSGQQHEPEPEPALRGLARRRFATAAAAAAVVRRGGLSRARFARSARDGSARDRSVRRGHFAVAVRRVAEPERPALRRRSAGPVLSADPRRNPVLLGWPGRLRAGRFTENVVPGRGTLCAPAPSGPAQLPILLTHVDLAAASTGLALIVGIAAREHAASADGADVPRRAVLRSLWLAARPAVIRDADRSFGAILWLRRHGVGVRDPTREAEPEHGDADADCEGAMGWSHAGRITSCRGGSA